MKLSVVIERDDSGFFAYCPELPNCHSQGDTFEEARTSIQEAVELYVASLDPEEIEELGSHEIYTGDLEVSVG